MGVERLIIIVIDFLPAIAYSQHLLIDKLTGILNLTLLCLMKVPAENYVVKSIWQILQTFANFLDEEFVKTNE